VRASQRRAFLLALFLVAGCTAVSTAPRTTSEPAAPVTLLGSGPLIVPYTASVDGLRVGGLSGIARAADGSYLCVVDNEGETAARVFRLEFQVGEDGVKPPAGKTALQIPVGAIRLEGLDGRNFDGEGIALLGSGNLLISSETEPSIREVSPAGKILGELPVPELFRAGEGRGIRKNQAFESLTLAPDGDVLWTANERALQQDGPDDEDRPSPVRLLRYERERNGWTPGAQYVYEVAPRSRRAGGFSIRGVADLLALPDGGLLALEREFVLGRGFVIQLFRVSLAGATDVSGLESLAGTDWTPVRKTLVFDFGRAGFVPDNLEGMAFGPDLPDGSRTLVVIGDNNFELLEQTQIVALRLPR
jgi:hypothetical protein